MGRKRTSPQTVTISFATLAQLRKQLTHLGRVADHPTAVGDETLGVPKGIRIVTQCAGSDNLFLTLGELGIDREVFQNCVFAGVQDEGYSISVNKIPATAATRLIDVVHVISAAKVGLQ